MKKISIKNLREAMQSLQDISDDYHNGEKSLAEAKFDNDTIQKAGSLIKLEQVERIRLGDKTPIWWLFDAEQQPVQSITQGKKKKDLPYEFNKGLEFNKEKEEPAS